MEERQVEKRKYLVVGNNGAKESVINDMHEIQLTFYYLVEATIKIAQNTRRFYRFISIQKQVTENILFVITRDLNRMSGDVLEIFF